MSGVDITTITNDRAKTHGDYTDVAECAQVTKELWRSRAGYAKLSRVQRETLDMLAHKIARVLSGNPDERDHWSDIAGYAKITADRVR